MITQIDTQVRQVSAKDKSIIANLTHFEVRVHRNLDWKTPLDWIGEKPFLIYEQNQRALAALACPPDPPEIAWIRLFTAHSSISELKAWRALWPVAYEQLGNMPEVTTAAALPMQGWFRDLLEREGFVNSHNVVMLAWDKPNIPESIEHGDIIIRPLNFDDLSAVEAVDKAAFKPLWQNSIEALQIAYRQASFATVAELNEKIVGYQISTANTMGGHLARLAVMPQYQGKKIGYCLVQDLLNQFHHRGARRVTVNTQSDNHASLKLYRKIGFTYTGEVYPVYEYPIE